MQPTRRTRQLYIENSVGTGAAKAFNQFQKHHHWTATIQHDIHPEMRQKEGDRWWIEDVTAREMVIVSCDLAIVENEDKRDCVLEVGAQIVRFASASYNRWDMMRGLCRHRLSIERHLQERPMVLKVWAGARAPQRADLTETRRPTFVHRLVTEKAVVRTLAPCPALCRRYKSGGFAVSVRSHASQSH